MMSEAVELAAADVQIATVRERTTRASQVVTLLAIVIPPLGLIVVAAGLWGVALSWVDVAVFLTLYVLTGLGTTVGYHRLFTHRSFETTKTVRADVRDPRLDDDPGPGDPVGDGPSQASRALRPGRGSTLASRRLRADRLGGAEGLLPRAHGLALPPQGDGARRPVREGPLRRPADPADRPDVLRLGRAELRGAVRDRVRGRRRELEARAARCSSGAA